jgi:hypothetical protein
MGIFNGKTQEEILSLCKELQAKAQRLAGDDYEELLELIQSVASVKWLEMVLLDIPKGTGKMQWQAEKACQMLTAHYNRQAIKLENKLRMSGQSGDELTIKFELPAPATTTSSDYQIEGDADESS